VKVRLRSSPVLGRRTHPFLASCSCPRGTTSFRDDEDNSSSEGSSSKDSYVEAPLENTQVRGRCFSCVAEKSNSRLGHTCAFSDGRSAGSS